MDSAWSGKEGGLKNSHFWNFIFASFLKILPRYSKWAHQIRQKYILSSLSGTESNPQSTIISCVEHGVCAEAGVSQFGTLTAIQNTLDVVVPIFTKKLKYVPKIRLNTEGWGGVGPQAIVEDFMNKGRAKVQTWGSVQKGFTIRKTKQDTNNFGGSQVANCASMDLMTQHKNSTVSSEEQVIVPSSILTSKRYPHFPSIKRSVDRLIWKQ